MPKAQSRPVKKERESPSFRWNPSSGKQVVKPQRAANMEESSVKETSSSPQPAEWPSPAAEAPLPTYSAAEAVEDASPEPEPALKGSEDWSKEDVS